MKADSRRTLGEFLHGDAVVESELVGGHGDLMEAEGQGDFDVVCGREDDTPSMDRQNDSTLSCLCKTLGKHCVEPKEPQRRH